MELVRLTKEINVEKDTCKISLEVVAKRSKGYDKADVINDDSILDLFLAVNRGYIIKNGKLVKKSLLGGKRK